ncbi:hypothetical protein Trydic_g6242 [Trypoxylus dichotomus]
MKDIQSIGTEASPAATRRESQTGNLAEYAAKTFWPINYRLRIVARIYKYKSRSWIKNRERNAYRRRLETREAGKRRGTVRGSGERIYKVTHTPLEQEKEEGKEKNKQVVLRTSIIVTAVYERATVYSLSTVGTLT